MVKRRYNKVRPKSQRSNARTVLDPIVCGISYRKDVLVQHPYNRYMNERFGISLFDELRPDETISQGYERIKKSANTLLVQDILEYVNKCVEQHNSNIRFYSVPYFSADKIRALYSL